MSMEAVSLIVTNFLVVAGWIVVFRQALQIKSREELRKIADLTSKTIEEIYMLCQLYYSERSTEHVSYESTNIKASFVLLSHYLLIMREAGISGNISPALTAFKIHATGGHFETINYRLQELTPNWKAELASSAQELRFRVEKAYFSWARERSNPLSIRAY